MSPPQSTVLQQHHTGHVVQVTGMNMVQGIFGSQMEHRNQQWQHVFAIIFSFVNILYGIHRNYRQRIWPGIVQGCSFSSQTCHTDLRPLALCLPGHCSSPTIPHTPFWGETLYFRLVRGGQSPAFVPNKSRQQQEQTERSDCVLSFLWQLLCKGPCT